MRSSSRFRSTGQTTGGPDRGSIRSRRPPEHPFEAPTAGVQPVNECRAGRRPSMVDVAERASVSLSTVSNVLNRPEVVARETRARVREAIELLGFVPNNSARQLRKGRSSAIGVVVFDLSNPYWGEVTK